MEGISSRGILGYLYLHRLRRRTAAAADALFSRLGILALRILSCILTFSDAGDASARAADPVSRSQLDIKAERYMSEYGNGILRLAYSYVHNMADAEDILQETLIRMLDAHADFENAAHEKAYIYRIAANVSKNHIAYSKRRETDELDEELIAEERRDLSFVWEAVKQLPQTLSEVVHLYYYEGYRTSEIASLLDRNESTVRSDLKRARDCLKNLLKEEYDFG